MRALGRTVASVPDFTMARGSFSHPLETYQNMEGSLEIHTPLAHLSSSLMLKLPLLTHTVAKLPRSNDSYVRKSDIVICLCRKSWQKGG